MKCTVCRGPAEYRVVRHNSKFCREHYNIHVHRQIERAVTKFGMFNHGDRIMLGVSGGKDSMALWHALISMGYDVRAVHLNNGFDQFSRISEETVRAFAQKHDLPLVVFRLPELIGADFITARTYVRKSTCSLCGTLKRYFLNRIALDTGCTVLATGHNLDDEAAFLLGNLVYWRMDYLGRQGPVLEATSGFAKKVKPLIRLSENEIRMYVQLHGLDVVDEKCPYSRRATSHVFKEIGNTIDENFNGSRSNFYFSFLEQMKPLLATDRSSEVGTESVCPECGYRTLRDELCFVCKLKELIRNGHAGSSLK